MNRQSQEIDGGGMELADLQPNRENPPPGAEVNGNGAPVAGAAAGGGSELDEDQVADGWRRIPRAWFAACLVLGILLIAAIAGDIALAIKYTRLKGSSPPPDPIITTPLLTNVPPVLDTKLYATAVVFGNFFTFPSHPQLLTKLVYTPDASRFCIRTEDSSWRNIVQCVEGANPRIDTPLVMLDWVGGPTIFFITTENFLSSINNARTNDTWRLSNLIDFKVKTHQESQLAAVEWLNGTSAWLYYQDSGGQLREFGIDDYRDNAWREGSAGALGPCKIGSGIAACRWIDPSGENEEVFCHGNNLAIQGRKYRGTAWNVEPYSVLYTPSNVTIGSGLSATTVKQGNDTLVLLTYLASSGSVVVQTRTTTNLRDEDFRAFSQPIPIAQGDGRPGAGIAAISWRDQAKVFVTVQKNILELTSNGTGATNWTTTTIPF